MRTAPQRIALAGAAVAALVTLPGLGVGTLWDNSETAYGEVAREILYYHDWLVLHFDGRPWFVQPPLYFWIAAVFAKILGVGTWALRLPGALATIAMGGLVAGATARFAGTRAGIYAALILPTALMQAVIGRLAIMDALLDLAVTAAILALFAGLEREDWRFSAARGTHGAWYAAWAAAGFGILAKGPVALVIPALVVIAWVLWERRDGGVVTIPGVRAWLGGIGLCFLIAAPWFVLVSFRDGSSGIAELIGHYTVGRYVGTIEGQTGPIWYYVPALILGFFPWIAFLPAAFLTAARDGLVEREASLARLALAWTIVPFVFFSLAQTKLPNYVALELPALAILVALWFDRVAAGEQRRAAVAGGEQRRAAVAGGLVVPVAVGALAVAAAIFARRMRFDADVRAIVGDLVAVGVVMGLGSLATLVALARPRWSGRAPYVLAATTVVFVLLVAVHVEPRVEAFKPIPRLAAVVARERRPDDAVVIQGVAGANALLFYTAPPVAMLPPVQKGRGGDPGPSPIVCRATRAFYVGPLDAAPEASRSRRLLAAAGRDGLYLYAGPPC